MVLSALAVVYINTDDTIEQGRQQMAEAYQVWKIDGDESVMTNIAMSLANGLVMVSVICMMTFVIVLLYKYECMCCLIGYMMFCSTTLLGFLGGHMWWVAIQIYKLPVDKLSYYLGLWNFAAVGVMAVFYGKGVPKTVTQGYLIATSVILAWHLDYFDEYSTWALLFMLALYDLCAVLTPCGPLKALVNLMSRDNAPEMPGLLYEAELPPEARRPGGSRNQTRNNDEVLDNRSTDQTSSRITVPLAVARVYNLPVIALPSQSDNIMRSRSANGSGDNGSGEAPLLEHSGGPNVPSDPTPEQLQADVEVQLPENGGRIQKIRRNGKTMFIERDRHGNAKRALWVDTQGRVFAESPDGDEEDGEEDEKNTIRLGLGDFIFYSVLVAKAAQYSYTTFVACCLVILAGLGGTLVLLSVYHHALPALPISIALGIFFYFVTRFFIEPYVEAVMLKPLYV
jgi:presenilin 1